MIGATATTRFQRRRLEVAMRRGSIHALNRAAFVLRSVAQAGLRTRKGPSPAGMPPHTHTLTHGAKHANRLRKAILYSVDKLTQSAVIGPAAHLAGQSGGMQEHGGRWKGQKFPQRPFMNPALKVVSPQLPRQWAGSVK